jgi:hypothetical protein
MLLRKLITTNPTTTTAAWLKDERTETVGESFSIAFSMG